MDCHRMIPAIQQTAIRRHLDIRAPRKLRLQDVMTWPFQRGLVLIAGDVFALGVSWSIARSLNHFFSPIPATLVWWTWFSIPSPFWVLVVSCIGLFTYAGLYQSRQQVKNYLQAGKLLSLIYMVSLVLMYFVDPKLDLPRSLFFSVWFISVLLIVLTRVVVSLALRPLEQANDKTSVFLIAPAHRLKTLADVLDRRAHVPVIGAALASAAHSQTTFDSILASKANLVLAESLPSADLASELFWKLRRSGISMQLVPSSRDMLYRRGTPETVAGIATLRLDAPLIAGWDYRLKRCIDFLGAAIGILMLAPLFLGFALAIKLDSPGPVFFRQQRVGLHGNRFDVWKFRTMVADAPKLQAELEAQNQNADGVLFKVKGDPRITRVGAFLRKTSLDELPQLFNVLFGQMSLVGPRPLPIRDVAKFDAWHHIRHQVLPGMTGLWQVSGRSDIDTFDDVARLDLHYIDNWSLNLDLEILAETVGVLFGSKGAY